MFSYEEHIKAVKLLIKYDLSCYSAVIRELGYPAKESIRSWCKKYSQKGGLHYGFIRQERYLDEGK